MKEVGQEEARLRMIDSEDLRAILEAQEERQHQMLKAVLETANQQQQALLEQVGRIFSAIGPTASPASAAEFVTNSLSTKLPEFIYDPDNGYTFDVWFNRFEDVIVQDGSTPDEAAKARLIVSKLDAVAYTRFTNHILPKRASELCYDDTVKTLKELFGHNTSVFARRYNYLRTQRNGESLSDYTGMVNRRHEMAEFNAITPEQMKCLVWICGLHTPDDADIRTRALRKMEDNPQTTLKELSLDIQQFLDIRRDAKLLGSHHHCFSQMSMQLPPRRTVPRTRPHAAFDVEDHTGRETATSSTRRATIANASVTRRATARISRTRGREIGRRAELQMRLDTGADFTLLSIKDWIKINRPKLPSPLVKLKSADKKDIKVRGYFECDFDINGHKGRGNCYVADTQSLLGLDWIAQNKPLLRRLTEDTIYKVSTTTSNHLRSSTSADSSIGPRDSKMEEQFNRLYGARRRHFEVGDAIYAKHYRGPKNTWMSGIIVRKVATRPIFCVAKNSFGRGISTS
ncbi:unnamed protein product [Toxocara canis]|uniref:Peptidase A2 domain-containing protein n=1 Tax=Toxocara canis TaxID=6265 RepID=A0A183UFP7_TOXCA|nr:unnamed protein product [Toxocara canis]